MRPKFVQQGKHIMPTSAPVVTVVPISFRYERDDGQRSSTKLSLAKDIYQYVVALFGDEKLAYDWLVDVAREGRETQLSKYSSYLREEALRLIIDPAYTYDYIYNPDFIPVNCPYTDEFGIDTQAPINIPAIMMCALEKRMKDPVVSIRKFYRKLRKSPPDTNYSNDLRESLLVLILRKELK